MNMKRFQLVCKVAAVLLKILAIMALCMVVFGLFFILFTKSNMYFTIDVSSRSFIFFVKNQPTEAEENLAALILSPPLLIVSAYTFWRGSSLFEKLMDGDTPFSFDFAQSVKGLSLIIIMMDILTPLLYSLILTIIMKAGYYFTFGLSSYFFIGLLLYIVAEILHYGVNLQQLSDETV